jgi:anti-sigma B factor antagonist
MMDRIEIDAYTMEDIDFLEISGEMTSDNCTLIKDTILRNSEQTKNFIINMKNVTYMDSTSIGTLMASVNFVRKRGGNIKLVGPNPLLMRVFDLVNATTIFEIYDKTEEALRSFRDEKSKHDIVN